MEENNKGWRQFQRVKLDRKQLARRVKKAETASTRHAHRFVIRRMGNVRLVRREITIWLLIVGAIVAGLGIQLIWGQMNYMKAAPSRGGSYAEAALGPIDTLNPLYASSSAESSAGRLLFSSLYNYDATASLHQDIATKMDVAESGRIYTVTLRDDVLWHDGKRVTAKDVVFTVNLMKNPSARSPLRINWLDVSVKEVAANKVEFTLPAIYAAFPYALTFPILPEHLLSTVNPATMRENTFSQSPVGSGPFKFELLQQVDPIKKVKAVHLVANSDYYRGKPKLDRFELQAYQSEESIVAALRSGVVSGAVDVSTKASESINSRRYSSVPQSLSSGVFVMFNTQNPLLNDVKLRKALQVGTDTEAVRKMIGHGTRKLELPFIGSQVGQQKDLPVAPVYSETQANQLLDDAGWKRVGAGRVKDGKKLEITITTTKNKEYQTIIDNLKKQWEKIGVSVKTKTIDISAENSNFVQDTLQGRNFDVLLYELSIGADPDVYAYWHSSQLGQTGYNFTNYVNKTADVALASARSRIEPELRNAKYRQFAKLWLDDAPAIALYQPVSEYIYGKNTTTVGEGSSVVTGADRYANILDWSVNTDLVYKTP